MTQSIVDHFKSIEVHGEYRKDVTIAFGMGDFSAQSVDEQQSVRKPGQRIVGGLMLQLRVGLLQTLRLNARSGLQMRIVDCRDQGHDQQAEREDSNHRGKPVVIEGSLRPCRRSPTQIERPPCPCSACR